MGVRYIATVGTSQDQYNQGLDTTQVDYDGDDDFDQDQPGDDDDGKPESSSVFNLTSGEQIRLSYDQVNSYQSKGKTATVVSYGYSDSPQTYVLDIDFASFDGILTQYNKDMADYWSTYY